MHTKHLTPTLRRRREFLASIGQGMLLAGVGSTVAVDLGLTSAHALETAAPLDFGDREPLVRLMQETPIKLLQRTLVAQIQQGVSLRELVIAGALANARSFGGQDYNGYHTFMALSPALEMSRQLPSESQALPILKVLYRNTNRIQEFGGRAAEVLHEVHSHEHHDLSGPTLQAATRSADMDQAEELFAAIAAGPANEAFGHLQFAVQDEVDVHRTVLAWRAWKMTEIAGESYAHTLLRQSVRYCVDTEQRMHQKHQNPSGIRQLLPQLLEELALQQRSPGTRIASDQELQDLSQTVFRGSRDQAARAVAEALRDDMSVESVGEALSLAANHLLLFDPGRSEQQANAEKPAGSVHGASVGVHACDSANAWRNIARVSNSRNQFASLIVGAYHTAGQSGMVQTSELPYAAESAGIEGDSTRLLNQLDEAVRAKEQLRAAAVTHAYLQRGFDPQAAFATLLQFAVSEEGALHAEKFYRTVAEEFTNTRLAYRDRHLVALARVSASEFGFPAAGQEEAKQLLHIG